MIKTITFDDDQFVLVPKEPTQAMLDAVGPKPTRWDATPTSRKLRELADEMRQEEYCVMVAVAKETIDAAHLEAA